MKPATLIQKGVHAFYYNNKSFRVGDGIIIEKNGNIYKGCILGIIDENGTEHFYFVGENTTNPKDMILGSAIPNMTLSDINKYIFQTAGLLVNYISRFKIWVRYQDGKESSISQLIGEFREIKKFMPTVDHTPAMTIENVKDGNSFRTFTLTGEKYHVKDLVYLINKLDRRKSIGYIFCEIETDGSTVKNIQYYFIGVPVKGNSINGYKPPKTAEEQLRKSLQLLFDNSPYKYKISSYPKLSTFKIKERITDTRSIDYIYNGGNFALKLIKQAPGFIDNNYSVF